MHRFGFFLCTDPAFLDGQAADACRQQDETSSPASAVAVPTPSPTA